MIMIYYQAPLNQTLNQIPEFKEPGFRRTYGRTDLNIEMRGSIEMSCFVKN